LPRKYESDRHVLSVNYWQRTEIGPKDTSLPVLSSFAASRKTTLVPLGSTFFKGQGDLITEEELARARTDPALRQQFLAQNLDRLLEAIKKMRRGSDQSADTARQLREGANRAVKLADAFKVATLGRAA
jgi:hypothetical protein